jgi:hypothetical protein
MKKEFTAPGPFVRRRKLASGGSPSPSPDDHDLLDELSITILDENDLPIQDEGA